MISPAPGGDTAAGSATSSILADSTTQHDSAAPSGSDMLGSDMLGSDMSSSDPATGALPPTGSADGSRRKKRQGLFATIAVVVIVIAAVAVLVFFRTSTSSIPFAPNNPGDLGTRAVAQILEREGARVAFVQTTADAVAALHSAESTTTLVIGNDFGLTESQVAPLVGQADTTVLFEPRDGALAAFAPGVTSNLAAGVHEQLSAACTDIDAVAAEAINPSTSALTTTNPRATTCFTTDFGAGMVRIDDLTILSSQAWLTNEYLADAGNAALGLRLLGAHESVVFFVPDLIQMFESPDAEAGTTGKWIVPVFLVFVGALVLAALWRGRRFGSLIPEPLPVTVRPEEVRAGRARLYRASRDYAYAATLMRAGTLTRIAAHLGLQPGSDRVSVVAAIVAATHRAPTAVDYLCYGPPPATADDLARLNLELDQLFREVRNS